MDEKNVVNIDAEMFFQLDITPEEGVQYLENKKAIDMSPALVRLHRILKQQTVPSS